MNRLIPETLVNAKVGPGYSVGNITLSLQYASRGSVILNPTVYDDCSPTVD